MKEAFQVEIKWFIKITSLLFQFLLIHLKLFSFLVTPLILVCPFELFAQNTNKSIVDTSKVKQLEEIVIISTKTVSDKSAKPLTTLDNYLEKSSLINMIKRGSYAWEPFINGMATERNVVTIDGMRVYGACTDKMDPVTSYVEITNLSKANVHSGQAGATGATIGGSLDLERKKCHFDKRKIEGSIYTGFESNNKQKILGGSVSYVSPRIYSDFDFMLRAAENYKSGGGNEVLYSQFTKYNLSAIAGYKISTNQSVEASLIYDHAKNVGYPALPMDVLSAKAVISSLEYLRRSVSPSISLWKTKFYYNEVEHIMDDSKRPIVPIRMDMPGWSKTAGFYTSLQGDKEKHPWKMNLSGHRNYSLAEMTMYPNTPGQKEMYMLTWPGLITNYGDLYLEDRFTLLKTWKLNLSIGMAIHHNKIDNTLGLESLKIFYPNLNNSKTRFLKRASTILEHKKENWNFTFGLAYGERAPSISEAYGFYLFNSSDRFDYIGNPTMKNEKSASVNAGFSIIFSDFFAKLNATHFYIKNYILGAPDTTLMNMTIGANGVKIYKQLANAQIFNASLDINYQLHRNLHWTNKFSYRYGTSTEIQMLPLMQPLLVNSSLIYSLKSFSAEVSVNGASSQNRYNAEFGEKPLPSYIVANCFASNSFTIGKQSILLKLGLENIFDKNYTTFADWNRLPRMGRNLSLNLIFNFK